MQRRTITTPLKTLTADANRLIAELAELGKELDDKLTMALERSWRLGGILLECKRLVGHGNWLIWLEANVPLSERHAQRHMELASSNPHAETVADLSLESIRKFRLRFVPDKERPQLEGDAQLPRASHHLTLLNDWRRWQRRVEIGQTDLDPEEARRDLQPLFHWMCELYDVPVPALAVDDAAEVDR